MKERLMSAGLTSETIEAAEASGFSLDKIFELLVKYGPIFLEIFKDLVKK